MPRVAVYRYDEAGRRLPDGWFTPEAAEAVFEARPSGMPGPSKGWKPDDPALAAPQALYRTAGGRWVLETTPDERIHGKWPVDKAAILGWLRGPEYRFITDIEALDWLNRNGRAGHAERFFAHLPDEQGPMPAEPGTTVEAALGDLLGPVDAYAEEHGCSRVEAVRRLVAAALGGE
jgi:hypothetical protein